MIGRSLLILLAVVMVAYWGSIGSAVMAFGLISMCCALLYQRFLNRDRSDIYE